MLGMSQPTTFATVSLEELWRTSMGKMEVTVPEPRDGIAGGYYSYLASGARMDLKRRWAACSELGGVRDP